MVAERHQNSGDHRDIGQSRLPRRDSASLELTPPNHVVTAARSRSTDVENGYVYWDTHAKRDESETDDGTKARSPAPPQPDRCGRIHRPGLPYPGPREAGQPAVLGSFLTNAPGAGQYGSTELFDLRIDVMVAVFLALAAIDHFAVGTFAGAGTKGTFRAA